MKSTRKAASSTSRTAARRTTIYALHILPPLAIGRLGSAHEPVANYTIVDNPEKPLDFRTIVGAETFVIDPDSGEITGTRVPETVSFKDGEHVRPVAPFLELFAQVSRDLSRPLVPVTLSMLEEAGIAVSDVRWRVTVANRKVVRRTNDPKDSVDADTGWFSTHDPQRLTGHSRNFVSERHTIDFGHVRFIRPNEAYPELRFRFTPAKGLIYGPRTEGRKGKPAPTIPGEAPPYVVPRERQVYDPAKGSWQGFQVPIEIDNDDTAHYTGPFVNETLPPSLFAIVPPAPSWLHDNIAISRGYLDDACDGIVEVELTPKGGSTLTACARITSGPPVLVPDSLFVRNLADDLEQVITGPAVPADEPVAVTRARAEDIVRRAYETVRFLNIAVMNGNDVQGRPALSLDTMPAEEAFDTDRMERPVMSPASVDTLAVLALHQQLYTALRSGTAPWFYRMIRQPEEAADYTDEGRRRMPALMCGADNNYLALTRHQIDTIRAASLTPMFAGDLTPGQPEAAPSSVRPLLTPRNRSALVNYAAAGNPVSSRPENAIANCCPGLEVDFRAVWRRVFEGLELREYDNLVIKDERGGNRKSLQGHRLLRVNGVKVIAQKKGPSPAGRFESTVLATEGDAEAVQPLEWSNAIAHVVQSQSGKLVTLEFSLEPSLYDQVWWDDDAPPKVLTAHLRVRPFWEGHSAVISKALAAPGELTQGLCSPWQNDYRECSCYYWASARPDYVNVEAGNDGTSRGDNWLQKVRTGTYVPDDYVDSRMILYDDLFEDWEKWLRFQVRGRDLPDSEKDPA